tara:strand:+ start:324 stop:695 length:372 start_codon:yes stop_codon:yes gene_type:complete
MNIEVAANAGGAFSPFGDITTLMVWQADYVSFSEFIPLFIPSMMNYLVPALIMSYFVPTTQPDTVHQHVELKRGARRIVFLFIMTICFPRRPAFPTCNGHDDGARIPPVLWVFLEKNTAQLAG